MERETRGEAGDITEHLLSSSRGYSFIQAMRLILHDIRNNGDDGDVIKRLHVHPELSLDFPGTDVTSIKLKDGDSEKIYELTASFLGLYGASSPLPAYYTEELMRDVDDEITVTRDFIDVINSPLYHLFFKIWSRCRMAYKVAEEKSEIYADRLFSMLGLPTDEFRELFDNPYEMNRYIGNLTQFPRSAEGLRGILGDMLDSDDVEVIQCVERKIPLGENALRLGESCCELGEDSVLGEWIDYRAGNFRIVVGAMDAESFNGCLPDGNKFKIICKIVNYYIDQALLWDVILSVRNEEVSPVVLGGDQWSKLGWNTWLGTPEGEGCTSVVMHPIEQGR